MQIFHEILIIQNINDQWRWIQMQMRDAAVKTNWASQKKKKQQPWTSSGLGIKLTLLHSSGELILDLGIKLALLVTLLVLARQNKLSNVADVSVIGVTK